MLLAPLLWGIDLLWNVQEIRDTARLEEGLREEMKRSPR